MGSSRGDPVTKKRVHRWREIEKGKLTPAQLAAGDRWIEAQKAALERPAILETDGRHDSPDELHERGVLGALDDVVGVLPRMDVDAALAEMRGPAARRRKTAKPARARRTGAAIPDWDATLKRALKRAHEDAIKETDRLRRLGIIDEKGRLVKKP
jgi:hypothetical protein